MRAWVEGDARCSPTTSSQSLLALPPRILTQRKPRMPVHVLFSAYQFCPFFFDTDKDLTNTLLMVTPNRIR